MKRSEIAEPLPETLFAKNLRGDLAAHQSRGRQLNVVLWVILVLGLAYYFGVGGFPMGHFKGDGTSMAIGARQIVEQGWDGPRIDYGRQTRPGVFWMLIFLRRLTGADTYILFSSISLASGVAGLLLAARFAAHFTRLPVPLCGIGILILFPDAVTWGCYPNGTVIAGCLGLTSFCLLLPSEKVTTLKVVFAGILAGLAVLMRVDAILMSAVFLPLLITGCPRTAAQRIALLGGIAAAITFGVLFISHISPWAILGQTSKVLGASHPPAESIFMRLATDEAFTACLAYFPLLTVLFILLGTARLVADRQWRILAIAAAGIVPILFVYGSKVYGSPLYFLIALFACLALAGIQAIAQAGSLARMALATVAGLLFLVQYPIGVNVTLRSKPYFPVAEPTLVHLLDRDLSSGPIAKVSVGIGPGGVVSNTEHIRFCSGLLFHPMALHAVKQKLLDAFDAMKDCIGSHEIDRPTLLVYSSEWATCTQVNKALQDLGYTCIDRVHLGPDDVPGDRFTWKRGENAIVHVNAWEIFDPWKHAAYFDDAPQRKQLIYVTGGGRERNAVKEGGHVTKVVYERDVLPSESVCVFEIGLGDGQ